MLTVEFTIEDARRIQDGLGLGEQHVIYLGKFGWVMAHTDDERAEGDDLAQCPVHLWMARLDDPCALPCRCFSGGPGWYRVSNVHEVRALAF